MSQRDNDRQFVNSHSTQGYVSPMRTAQICSLVVCRALATLLLVIAPAFVPAFVPVMSAQAVKDSTKRVTPMDTTVAAPVQPSAKPKRIATRLTPPLSPTRAFLYSFALPGFGQSRLDRGTSGALFASIELAAITMVRRSNADLAEARRYRIDTLPSDFVTDGTTLTKSGIFTSRYTGDLVRTRRLHVEDWIAVLAFNHLFSGADAFVAAQLWDVPVSITAVPRSDGATLVASIRW